ncbi:hypothetical protein O1R50_19785 [Glycomyces luteolus]|uniref:Uncharacterized protein n=1 Tax=Glycomyces luteolus TaxID=2670330 RepID=A0A9X3PFX8_9ACTN|nr:hypothetical protein [Glycomyces luteolus]MDA1361879.1 hypothetical protein [Glycomyces luteolus]
MDAYPGGRVPALAPITWTADGWPEGQTVNGAWGSSYPFPNLTPHPVPSLIGTVPSVSGGTEVGYSADP